MKFRSCRIYLLTPPPPPKKERIEISDCDDGGGKRVPTHQVQIPCAPPKDPACHLQMVIMVSFREQWGPKARFPSPLHPTSTHSLLSVSLIDFSAHALLRKKKKSFLNIRTQTKTKTKNSTHKMTPTLNPKSKV